MKKILAAAALLAATVSGAMAADLAPRTYVKAPEPVAPVYNWTGFYIGANGGGGSTSFSRTGFYDTNPVNDSRSQTGYFVGGQVGYNWQFNQVWVLGIEADVQGSNFHNVFNCGAGPYVGGCYDTSSVAGYDLTTFGTVRGRIGYAMNNWLPYITGGYAWGNVRYSAFDYLPNNSQTASATASGWTAGGGVEYGITQHWTVKAEYLYIALNGTNITPIGPTYAVSVKTTANIGRFGVNYRF